MTAKNIKWPVGRLERMHPIAVETLQESQQFIVNNENVDKRKPVLCIKEGEKELDWILISSSH